MKTKHRLVAAVAASIAVLPAAAVASALMSTEEVDPYAGDGITVSPDAPTAGTFLRVRATGFRPNSQVVVAIDTAPPVVVTDAVTGSGRSNTKLDLPADATGDRSISVNGVDPEGHPRTLWINVVVGP